MAGRCVWLRKVEKFYVWIYIEDILRVSRKKSLSNNVDFNFYFDLMLIDVEWICKIIVWI